MLEYLLIYCTPDKINNLISQIKKDNTVMITEYMFLEKDLELRKLLCMLILKNNQISTLQDEIYNDFTGFKHDRGITHLRNVIFEMTQLVEDKNIA